MSLRSVISGGGALGLRRRLWSLGNGGESSSLSDVCLLLLRNPSRRFIVSLSPAAAADPPPSISVAFLVDSCGLSPDSAAAAIKKLSVNPKASSNPKAVLELFRSQGFSGAQIARIVARRPRVLVSKTETTLKPKIDFLRSEGFSQNDISKLVTSLSRSLEKAMKPNFDVLRTILPSKSDLVVAVMRSHWLLTSNLEKTMLPNYETLRAIGLSERRISKLIMVEARVLTRPPRRFDEYIDMLKGIGSSHTSFKYIHALIALSRLSRATLRKKISIYRKLGFTEEDFFTAFKRAPTISGLSEHHIVKSMDFLVRALNCEPRDVLLRPVLLTLSLEGRLIPRAFVRTTLISKGLLRGDRLHNRIFLFNEEEFIDNYVIKFRNELPQLLEKYEKLKPKDVRSSVRSESSA